MCEGQWLEVRLARKRRPTWSEYSEVIDKKTASLFACCCRAGGLVRHAPKMELSALERFGRAFGRAFQLMDDAADAGSDRVRLPVGPRVLRRRASAQAASARAALAPLASRQERAGLAGLTTAVYEG
jgi:hypothetical protein